MRKLHLVKKDLSQKDKKQNDLKKLMMDLKEIAEEKGNIEEIIGLFEMRLNRYLKKTSNI